MQNNLISKISDIPDMRDRLAFYQNQYPQVVDRAFNQCCVLYDLEDKSFKDQFSRKNLVAMLDLISRIESILVN
ncbi:hypothetical protein OAJ27_01160 [bacterium]|nr:hypothetical protein [bacterium]